MDTKKKGLFIEELEARTALSTFIPGYDPQVWSNPNYEVVWSSPPIFETPSGHVPNPHAFANAVGLPPFEPLMTTMAIGEEGGGPGFGLI